MICCAKTRLSVKKNLRNKHVFGNDIKRSSLWNASIIDSYHFSPWAEVSRNTLHISFYFYYNFKHIRHKVFSRRKGEIFPEWCTFRERGFHFPSSVVRTAKRIDRSDFYGNVSTLFTFTPVTAFLMDYTIVDCVHFWKHIVSLYHNSQSYYIPSSQCQFESPYTTWKASCALFEIQYVDIYPKVSWAT